MTPSRKAVSVVQAAVLRKAVSTGVKELAGVLETKFRKSGVPKTVLGTE